MKKNMKIIVMADVKKTKICEISPSHEVDVTKSCNTRKKQQMLKP